MPNENMTQWLIGAVIGLVQFIFFSALKRAKEDTDVLRVEAEKSIEELKRKSDKNEGVVVEIFNNIEEIKINQAKIATKLEWVKCIQNNTPCEDH